MTGSSEWWQDAVVYQVYPRSFADASGDGVGDLRGLAARIEYVASLGVDAVWLTPFQTSPQADHGYDVSDYCDVDPLFGTLDDVDRLLTVAHQRNLRVLVDLVPNHCSDRHPAFRAAVAAGPGSPERQRFHFRRGRGADGSEPPNNWHSVFGGPAWTRVTEPDGTPGEWYLHMYAPEQPDWNWEHPATAELFDQVLRFWFDRGVDGVRIDVAHGLVKADGLPDLPDASAQRPGLLRSNPLASDQEAVHEVYRRWRVLADGYDPPRCLVGEVNLPADRAARYVRPDELHLAFAFAFIHAEWGARSWREAVDALLAGGSTVTWVTENHDVPRAVTRYAPGGDEARGRARARAALLVMLALPGTVYLYQGQELGLPEVDVPASRRQDPAWSRGGISRDGCRVPLPWTRAEGAAYGFSPHGTSKAPWLAQPSWWGEYSVEAAEDDDASVLALVRRAVHLRGELRRLGTLASDGVTWLDTPSHVLAFTAVDGFVCAVNLGEEPAPLPAGDVLLASGARDATGQLPPDTAVWLTVPAGSAT